MTFQNRENVRERLIILPYEYLFRNVSFHIQLSRLGKGIRNDGILIDKNDSEVPLMLLALADIRFRNLLIGECPIDNDHEIVFHAIAVELIHHSGCEFLKVARIIPRITLETASVTVRIQNHIMTVIYG